MTHEEMMAAEEAAKATAAAYNQMNPTGGDTPEENEARAAAAELNKLEGSMDHDGNHAVRADTSEEVAAAEAKKAEAAEADKDKKPEDKPEDRPEEDDDAGEVEWIETDSKELNAVLGTLKAEGVTAADADKFFGEALSTGDVSRIDREALVEAVGEAKAELIMGGVHRYVAAEGEALLERTKTVQDAVGGADNWGEMVKWARGKAKGDADFAGKVNDLNEMMNGSSEFQAAMAAEKFAAMYNADPKNSTLGAKAEVITPHGKPAVEAAVTVEPMTAREYADAVEDASRNLRGADQHAKLAELSKAREAGRRKGL